MNCPILYFNESNRSWTERKNENIKIIRAMIVYLESLFNSKGYIYLNEIYETFGIDWDPKEKNLVWIRDDANTIGPEYAALELKNGNIIILVDPKI